MFALVPLTPSPKYTHFFSSLSYLNSALCKKIVQVLFKFCYLGTTCTLFLHLCVTMYCSEIFSPTLLAYLFTFQQCARVCLCMCHSLFLLHRGYLPPPHFFACILMPLIVSLVFVEGGMYGCSMYWETLTSAGRFGSHNRPAECLSPVHGVYCELGWVNNSPSCAAYQ
jgi:hypothetical protein